MKLIAFDGTLALKQCCAKPQNAVRAASVEDVIAWLRTHPDTHEAIRRVLDASERP